jgi:hypothetical protein
VLSWLVTDGQEVAKAVSYVPLPQNVQKVALDTLGRMEVGH